MSNKSYKTYMPAPYRSRRTSERLVLGTYIALIIIIVTFFHAPTPARAAILSKAPNNLSLVGYWSFDEGVGTLAGDLSGNGNTGTVTGATWTNGKHGKALSFDGIDDWINNITQPNIQISPNVFTVSGFIKPGNLDSRFITPQANGIDNWIGYSAGNRNLEVFFTELADVNNRSRSSTVGSVPVGAWTHWAVSFNDKNVKIYINGVLDSEYTETIDIGGWGSNWVVGQRGNSTWWYLGLLDDLRVYNRVLSATDVANLYRAGQITRKTVSNQGLVGYWPFNEGVGSIAGDSSGNGYNGSFSGAVSWTNGKRGKAVDFAGGNIDSNNSTPFNFGNNNFSVGAWFKLDSTSSYKTVVSKGGFWANDEFVLYALNGVLYFYVDKGGVKYYTPTSSLSTGQWYYAFGVYDGSYINLYLNGAYVGQTAVSNLNIGNATNLKIGSGGGGSDAFDGLIDEVRVYNRALSATEILNLYKQTETKINSSQNTRLTDGLVGLWSFNGADISGTTAYDRSGQGNNGTISGATTAIGKVGQGMSFNGTGNNVVVLDNASIRLTSYSASVWIKPQVDSDYWTGILGKPGRNFNFWLGASNSASGFVHHRFRDTASGNSGCPDASGIIIDGTTWSHVVITNDGTTCRTYINGSVVQSGSVTGTLGADSTNFIIGSNLDGASSEYYKGVIDEVRLYNRALSADEAKQLYNMGK